MATPIHLCTACERVAVPYVGRLCPKCRDEQMRAGSPYRAPSEPAAAPPELEPAKGKRRGGRPRGPAPDGRKMLSDHIRMLRTVQGDIGFDLYRFNERGVRERKDTPEDRAERAKLAERLVEIGNEITAAAKEERQWRDAEWAAQKKLTPAQLVEQAQIWLVEKGTVEEKRRAVAALLESLGEPALKAVP